MCGANVFLKQFLYFLKDCLYQDNLWVFFTDKLGFHQYRMYYIRILLEVIIFMYWWSFWIGTGRSRHSFVFSKRFFFSRSLVCLLLLCLLYCRLRVISTDVIQEFNFFLDIFLLSYWLTVAFCVRYIKISFFKFICECIQKDYQMV